MPEAEYSTTARLPVPVIWTFVREMNNWAPFLRGYQSHEKHGENDSVWVLKGDVGMVTRTVKFRVHVDEWGEPKLVRFTLKGVNEPMEGGGEFRLEPWEDAGVAAPPPARLGLFARLRALALPHVRRPGRARRERGHRARRRRLAPQLHAAHQARRPDGPDGGRADEAPHVARGRRARRPHHGRAREAPGPSPEDLTHESGSQLMVEYDPFLPQVIEDPHPVYAKLREEDPCCFIPKYDTYFLSRFEDIWNASMDEKSYSTEAGSTFAQLVKKIQPVTPMINNMDPPRHTHMRSKIVPYFTPGGVKKLEPQIAKFVADAFAEVKDEKQADLFNGFAAKVSVKVACLANGFPMEDSDMLNALVWRFFGREEGVEGMTQDGVNAMMEMFGYFGELIAKRRAAGADRETVVDLVCRYEDEEGKTLDVEAASSHLSMFLIGGAETFPKTFASALLRFWQHKDQRAEMVKNPTLIPEAYREALRYDMPTQFLMRKLLTPVKLHDKTMQPGQKVAFLYPSANRDRREFPDPDRFDIKRNPPRILSFGHGIHLCIGQHFARMEAKHCIQTLLAWAPDYEVKAKELRRLKTEFVQGWESMPVVFER